MSISVGVFRKWKAYVPKLRHHPGHFPHKLFLWSELFRALVRDDARLAGRMQW